MDLYEALKAVHVLAAVVWVGSNFANNVLGSRRMRNATGDDLVEQAREFEWYGNRFLIPSSLLLIASGFGMTADADLSLGDFWLSFALAGWIVSFILGAAFAGPTLKKFHQEVAAAGGTVTESAQKKVDSLLKVARFELVLLVLIVIDMVVKPGL